MMVGGDGVVVVAGEQEVEAAQAPAVGRGWEAVGWVVEVATGSRLEVREGTAAAVSGGAGGFGGGGARPGGAAAAGPGGAGGGRPQRGGLSGGS